MQIRAFRADAVVMATGGNGLIFGKSTNSVICTGGAASRCYQAGAWYANPEMIQVHPTAIPGADKCRLMSESARGEGGRVWVPRKKGDDRPHQQIPEEDRWYFLEERYPAYGNLVPRDIASREIFDVCVNHEMGVAGQNQVYLDLTHKEPEYLTRKLGAILDIYEKFVGEDPRFNPMRIFPTVHYTMGGLWTQYSKGSYAPETPHGDHKPGMVPPVDTQAGRGMALGAPNNMMTNVPGLYAFGEVNFAFHGATRLGANALLSCIFDGLFSGVSVYNYANEQEPASALDASVYDEAVRREQDKADKLLSGAGIGGTDDERTNPYAIGKELGDEMTAACTVVKSGPRLEQCLRKLDELADRYAGVRLGDDAAWSNQTLSYTRALGDMIVLAQAIAKGSILREESRGSHYRTDFQDRDDERFLKTTIAQFDPGESHRCRIAFRDVDTSLVKPRARTYGKTESKPEAKKQAAAAAS